MVALAPDEIFENMLQLKHFRLYSERILYRKWLQLLATKMLGEFGACYTNFFKMIDVIWGVLIYYFDQIQSYKVLLFIRKNND